MITSLFTPLNGDLMMRLNYIPLVLLSKEASHFDAM